MQGKNHKANIIISINSNIERVLSKVNVKNVKNERGLP